ncbi:MAG: hypothetical protein ACLQDY_14810 [Streptosporangiaceae bacterium]
MITGSSREGMRRLAARMAVPAVAAGSLAVAGAAPASAAAPHGRPDATAACGSYCDDLWSLQLGPGTILNARIPGMTGQPGGGGQAINMRQATSSDPNEDFVHHKIGVIKDFCRSAARPGAVLSPDSVACVDYRADPAYELDFAPDGNESGYCLGTSGTPSAGASLTARLIACGTTTGTLLIPDLRHMSQNGGLVLISGATTSFSHPDVLTVNTGSARPANQILIEPENLLTGGTVEDSQQFGAPTGPA